MQILKQHIKSSHVFRKYSKYMTGVCCLIFAQQVSYSQVLKNNGAVITIKENTVVQAKDVENSTGAIENNGAVKVSGNWNNNASFSNSSGNISFNGSGNQSITKPGGEVFFNFELNNKADSVSLKNSLQIKGAANFAEGQLNTGYDIDFLGEVICGIGKINAWWGTISYPVWATHVIEGTYYNLTLKGNSVKTLCGNVHVLNKLTIEGGTLELGTYDLTIDGVTEISGTLSDNNLAGTSTFKGKVTLNPGASWNFSGNGNAEFQNGLVHNGNSFNSGTGTYKFTTRNQNIDGISALTLNSKVEIAAGVQLTNKITTAGIGLTLKGNLVGINNTSIFRNEGITSYEYTGVPMSTGILDATFAGNIFRYSGGAQTMAAGATNGNYYHLVITGSNIKTFNGNIHVAGNLTVQNNTTLEFGSSAAYTLQVDGDFNASAGNLDMDNGSGINHVLKLYGTNNSCANLYADDQSIIEYLGGDGQKVFASANYRNINFAGTGTKILMGNLTAGGLNLNMSVNVNAGTNELYLSNASVNINRTAGAIIGKMKRRLSGTSVNYLFPVGTDTSYNSLEVNFANLTAGDYTVQFVAGDVGTNGLPLNDDGVEVHDRFTSGYWLTKASAGLASTKYNLKLNTEKFGIDVASRILKKESVALFANGKHDLVVGDYISRTELNGISTVSTIFSVGKGRPIIVTQPQNVFVCDRSDARFLIKATGHKPLNYQWYKVGTPDQALTNGVDYAGTTTDTLTVIDARDSDEGEFYFIVRDAAGHAVISSKARLTVNNIPVIVLSSTRDTICNNAFATIQISPSQIDTIYTWQIIKDPGITGASDGTGIQIHQELQNANTYPAKVIYAIKGTGPTPTLCESTIVYDTIWVNPTPNIAVAASHDTICYNEGVTLNTSALMTGTKTVKYHLRIETNGGITGYKSSGDYNLGSFTDNLVNTTLDTQQITYVFKPYIDKPSDNINCENGIEKQLTIKINPQPRIQIQAAPDTLVCYNEGVLINVAKLNPTHIGNWMYDVAAVASHAGVSGFTATATSLTGNLSQSNLVNNTDTLQWVDYTFTPRINNPRTGLSNCDGGEIKKIRIYINPRPKINIAASEDTVCYDQIINFNISDPNSKIKGNWKYHLTTTSSSPLLTGFKPSSNDNTTMSFNDHLVNNSTNWQSVQYHFVPVIKDPRSGKTYCDLGKDTTVTIYVNPRPKIVAVAEDTICFNEGTTFTITKPNNVIGTWVYDVAVTTSDPLVSGYFNKTDAQQLSFTESILNKSNSVQWLDYHITPKIKAPRADLAFCENGKDTTIRIYVNPKPLIKATVLDTILCSDDIIQINISSKNGTIIKDKYVQITSSFKAGKVSGVQASGHFPLANFSNQLINLSDSVQVVTYRIQAEFREPRSNKLYCVNGTDTTIKIYVNPKPRVTLSPALDTICDKTATSFTISTISQSKNGIRFRYTSTAMNAGTVSGLMTNISGLTSGAIIQDNLTNLTNSKQLVRFVITPYILDRDGVEKCTNGYNDTSYVWVEPTPVITANNDTVCDNSGAIDIIIKSSNIMTREVRYTYSAVAQNSDAVTGMSSNNTGLQLSSHINDALNNTTSEKQQVIYTITPWVYDVNGNLRCSDSPINVSVWVEPTPVITANNDTVCDNSGATDIIVKSNNLMTREVRYTYSGVVVKPGTVTGMSLNTSGLQLSAHINDVLDNSTSEKQQVIYTITPWVYDINGNLRCSGSPISVSVWVEPTPVITANNDTVCDNSDATDIIIKNNNIMTREVRYTYSGVAVKPGTVMGISLNTSGLQLSAHINDVLDNSTSEKQQVIYTITPWVYDVNGNLRCSGSPISVSVWVEPTPVITANNDTVCDNSDATDIIVKSSNIMTREVRYTYSAVAQNPGTVSGISSNTSGLQLSAHINDVLDNSTSEKQQVIYAIIPWVYDINGNLRCSGSPINISVWVEPTVTLFAIGDTLCNETSTKILPTSNAKTTLGVRYTWTISSNSNIIGQSASIGKGTLLGDTIMQTLRNNSNAAQKITYTITPHVINVNNNNACTFSSKSIDIWVNPTARIYANINKTLYCDSGLVSFDIQSKNGQVIGEKYYQLTSTFDSLKIRPDQQLNGNIPVGKTFHHLLNLTDSVQKITYYLKAYIKNPKGNNEDCYQGFDTTFTFEVLPKLKTIFTPSVYNGSWNISCKGYNNGSIKLHLLGGMISKGMNETEALYTWSNGSSSQHLNNLNADTFNVHIKDINGCNNWSSIELKEPDKLVVTTEILEAANCSNVTKGKISANVIGGTKQYKYYWYSGEVLKDTTKVLANLSFGEYKIVVKDANLCIDSAKETFDPNGNISFSIISSRYTSNGNDIYGVSCHDSINGFLQPSFNPEIGVKYTYKWYKYINKQYIPYGTQNSLNGLDNVGPGKYMLEIGNAAGCKGSNIIDIKEPPKVIIQTDISKGLTEEYQLTCDNSKDGSVQINASGGYMSFDYSWNGPGITSNDTSSLISSLDAGIYYLTLQDHWKKLNLKGQVLSTGKCTYIDTFELRKPAPLTNNPILSHYDSCNVSCVTAKDGSIKAVISGGIAPYKYFWFNDDNQIKVNDTLTLLDTLSSGNYSLKVTYGNICNSQFNYKLISPTPIKDSTVLSKYKGNFNLSCFNYSDGTIHTFLKGGIAPYSYSWKNKAKPSIEISNEDTIGSLKEGIYTLIAKDKNNCVYTKEFKLTQPLEITAKLESKVISCNAKNDGSAKITSITGGVAPYTYVWSNSAKDTTLEIKKLPKGDYFVVIKDINSCIDTNRISVREPDPMILKTHIISNYHGQNISCFGKRDAELYAEVSGGTKPYTFEWHRKNNSIESFKFPNNDTITNLPYGNYYVIVSDSSFKCFKRDTSIIINQPDSLVTMMTKEDVTCFAYANGKASVIASGGTAPYRYQWENNNTESSINGLDAKSYKVTVADVNNCLVQNEIQIDQPDTIKVNYFSESPYCPATKDGRIELFIKGGTKPYGINWNNGLKGKMIEKIQQQEYIYTVTDSNDCEFQGKINLIAKTTACLDIPKAFSPNNDTYNDKWNIQAGDPEHLENLRDLFKNAVIEVYNRWGELVYRSGRGYNEEWNGHFKGKSLPMDSYYYSIDLGDGSPKKIGIISIVK